MNTSAQTEIRNYLLSKNLPIDLLIEVQDHFTAQISDLEKEGRTFEEAFEKTKNSWFSELRFSKYNIQFDLNDRTYFEKKIRSQLERHLLKRSVIATCVAAIILFASAHLLRTAAFHYFIIALIVSFILTPVAQYFWNLKLFKLDKKYANYKLTLSQNVTRLSLVLGGCFSSFLYNISAHTDALYETFHELAFGMGAVTIILILFLFFLNARCFFAQRDYLKQMSRIQPFLKYLRAS